MFVWIVMYIRVAVVFFDTPTTGIAFNVDRGPTNFHTVWPTHMLKTADTLHPVLGVHGLRTAA